MSALWIVDREARRRDALARLAAAPEGSVSGDPSDLVFETAPAPHVILLGLPRDCEAELEFVHRTAGRLRGTRWILLPERGDLERTPRLFDALDAEVRAYPPEARDLRRLIAAPTAGAEPLPLSDRAARDALGERFGRWLGDLELPGLLRALDPRYADVPLLALGEPGTGRGLAVRYVHARGGIAGGELAHVVCSAETAIPDVERALAARRNTRRARSALTVWLDEADRLPPAVQRELARWIELAPPDRLLSSPIVRWAGSARDPEEGLEEDLRRALGSVLQLRLPPLRTRPEAIAAFASATARAWCERRGERARRFGEDALAVLEEYPWPRNLAELESVVTETLLASPAEPIPADELQHEGAPFAPLEIGEIGVLVEEDRAETPTPASRAEPPRGGPHLALLPEDADFAREPEPEIEDRADRSGAGPAAGTAPEPAGDALLKRLVAALSHEVRNPLSSIRTFAELLPHQYGNAEFRTRFAELVERDVRRIEDVVERLRQLATLVPPGREAVDVAALLEELLEQNRVTIHERRLVVLKELEAGRSLARGDTVQLRLAFEALLDRSLRLVPERGSLYFASRHHPAGAGAGPSVRVLVRFQGPRRERTARIDGLSPAEHSLEIAFAEAIVRAHGGSLTIDTAEGGETLIVVDLPGDDPPH